MRAWVRAIYGVYFIYQRPLNEMMVYSYHWQGKKKYHYYHKSVIKPPGGFKKECSLLDFIDRKIEICGRNTSKNTD